MPTYFTQSETTRRESLADTIAVRTPMAVPMIAQLPHTQMTSTIEEWSIDEPFAASSNLRDITATNQHALFEGFAAYPASDDVAAPTRLRAIAEINARRIAVSGSDLKAQIAGMNSRMDYESGRMVTRHMQQIDHTLLWGRGGTATGGASGTPRRCQGMMWWAAWTGLERTRGTSVTATISDPYGVAIPRSMFSTFVDFENSGITGDSFYTNLISRIAQAGGDMSQGWVWWAGRKVMARVAKFLMTDVGVPVNDRQTSAEAGVGYDYLVKLIMPDGTSAFFRTNHWLDNPTQTFTVDNTTGAVVGTVNRTFAGNQTLLGHRPGSVRLGWYREPKFDPNPYTGGDFMELAILSEYSLLVDHPLDVAGAGNCLA